LVSKPDSPGYFLKPALGTMPAGQQRIAAPDRRYKSGKEISFKR
jgi:hypothetical protein